MACGGMKVQQGPKNVDESSWFTFSGHGWQMQWWGTQHILHSKPYFGSLSESIIGKFGRVKCLVGYDQSQQIPFSHS